MSAIYRTRQGDRVDQICHRYYGRRPGATEAVYQANPGLADLGTVLDSGVEITLPDLPDTTTESTIRLWD